MPKVIFVKKARKNYEEDGIKKGDSYYHWKFRFGGIHRSLTKPRNSQLTQSEHLGNLYSVEESIEGLTTSDIQEGCLDEIIALLDEVYDTCDDRKSNMPDQLQESDAGQTLQSYMDAAEDLKDQLEAVDLELNEEELHDLAEEEAGGDDEDEVTEDEIEELFQTKLEERKQEILDEIQACTLNL